MFQRTLVAVLLVLLACAPGSSQSKRIVPKLIVTARYVLVTTYYGSEFSPNVIPEDRRAVADIQQAVQKWRRYQLVYRAENADLILVVRKGRLASVTPQIGIGSSHPDGTRRSIGIGAEAGPANDWLAIYDAHSGIDSPPLWQATQREGLNPPDLSLFKRFKEEVEEAARKP